MAEHGFWSWIRRDLLGIRHLPIRRYLAVASIVRTEFSQSVHSRNTFIAWDNLNSDLASGVLFSFTNKSRRDIFLHDGRGTFLLGTRARDQRHVETVQVFPWQDRQTRQSILDPLVARSDDRSSRAEPGGQEPRSVREQGEFGC